MSTIITRYCPICKRTTKHLETNDGFHCRSLAHSTPLQLWLKTSGGGPWVLIGHASDFREADTLVETLDQRYLAWEQDGFPMLHSSDPVGNYEGCDIEARGLNGRVWDLDGDDGWVLRK